MMPPVSHRWLAVMGGPVARSPWHSFLEPDAAETRPPRPDVQTSYRLGALARPDGTDTGGAFRSREAAAGGGRNTSSGLSGSDSPC